LKVFSFSAVFIQSELNPLRFGM